MSYRVLLDGKEFPVTAVVPRTAAAYYYGGEMWYLANEFVGRDNAIDAAEQWLRQHPDDHVDVEKDGAIVWCSKDWQEGSNITSERTEVDSRTDLDKPLNIKREDLISRLTENLDKEKADRAVVEARERDARIGVQQFVTDHEDEIIQWIGVGAPGGFGSGSWEDIARNMARFFEDNDYKPKSAQKSRRENELEKFVRVLTMATDSTVEVKPNQPIYDLL